MPLAKAALQPRNNHSNNSNNSQTKRALSAMMMSSTRARARRWRRRSRKYSVRASSGFPMPSTSKTRRRRSVSRPTRASSSRTSQASRSRASWCEWHARPTSSQLSTRRNRCCTNQLGSPMAQRPWVCSPSTATRCERKSCCAKPLIKPSRRPRPLAYVALLDRSCVCAAH